MRTQAQIISGLLSDDGQCWESADGVNLADLCKSHGARVERHEQDDSKLRYVFPDDSVITVLGDGWDYGFADCWCWAEVGHNDDCPLFCVEIDGRDYTEDAARDNVSPLDMRDEVEPGCRFWTIEPSDEDGETTGERWTMGVWPDGRGAICYGGNSHWGDWSEYDGELLLDDTDDDGVRIRVGLDGIAIK